MLLIITLMSRFRRRLWRVDIIGSKFGAQSIITKLTEDTEVTQVTDEETQVAIDSLIDLEVSK
jgi:hypothetical protein